MVCWTKPAFSRFSNALTINALSFHFIRPRTLCSSAVVTARCGGWISAPNGTLTSPGYPGGTERGLNCSWIIQVTRGHYVELTFIDLNMQGAVNGQCTVDNFIEIRDYNESGCISITCRLCRSIITCSILLPYTRCALQSRCCLLLCVCVCLRVSVRAKI